MVDDKLPDAIFWVRIVFLSLAFAMAAVDLYLLLAFGPRATISELLRDIGERWGMFTYIVAFGMGNLFYHLFGPR